MEQLKNNGYHVITIVESHKGETYSFTLPWDGDIWDWLRLFKKILVCMEFATKTIEEVLPEEE